MENVKLKIENAEWGSGLLTACLKSALLFLILNSQFSILNSSAATLLSLASTNDYFFTTPISTNLTGKTFVLDGQGAACLVPRAEDISFLREAFEERSSSIVLRHGISDPTVSSNMFYAAGRFNDYYTERIYFSPSFGYWDGYIGGYQSGYFVKPGLSIETDFRETGPDYLWDGHSTETNVLQAFVGSEILFPTNGTGSILSLTNATLAGTTWLKQIKSAYEFLEKNVRVLGWDGSVHALAPSVWTDRSESYRTIVRRTPEGGIRYTYPRYDGRQGSGTYYTGFDLGDWTTTSGKTTNAFPCTETSYVFVRDRTVNREHEEKITYWGATGADTERYVFQIGEDYEYNKVSTVPFESSGNMILDIPMADYRLTNAVKEVSAIVLARFRVLRRESFSGRGYSPVPPATSTTNYFVFVTQTDCERRDDGKFDTELDFCARIREILNGYQIIEWCQACPLPTINAPLPSTAQTLSATRARRVYLTFEDIRVFPYIRREWNARVLD